MNSKHDNSTPTPRSTNGTPPLASHLLKLLTIFLTLSAAACSSQGPGTSVGGTDTPVAGKTGCNSDKDCKTAGGVCNTTTHYCDNPSRCDEDSQCLYGYQCNNHTCKKSLCDEPCEKGVCSLTKKNTCVSKSKCTPATAELDCVGTDVCYNNSCQPIDTVKGALSCGGSGGPGVFNNSKSDPKCVDKEGCTQDNECTSNYCNIKFKTCYPNSCEKPNEACSTGGVCTRDSDSPNGYKCKNKPTCSKAKDCADGYLCVKQSSTANGTCLPKNDVPTACNPGCRGNQTCEYDENSFVASCKESASCQNDIDCLGEKTCDPSDRICKTQSSSPACNEDEIDKDSTKENITSTATSDLENLILCEDDTDTYTYHVDAPATGEKKSLIVTVNINKADVNTRDIILEVGTTSSDTVTQSNIVNGQPTSSITVTVPITGESTYTIKVKGESHQNKPVDVHYSLTAKVVDTSSVQVCEESNIRTLDHNSLVRGNFSSSDHTGLATTCASGSENAYSHVYKLELTERSYTKVDLIQRGGNLALSVRASCYNQYSEVGCSNAQSSTGEMETVAKVLNPGTYYVVVTSNSQTSQQNAYYELTATVKPALCPATEPATCTSDGKLRRCNDSETDHIVIDCQGGCTPQAGGAVCNGREGDTCLNPIQIVADAGAGGKKQKKGTIKVNEKNFYSNSYVATCSKSNLNSPSDFSNITQGNEIVFRANVAAGEAVIGSLSGFGRKSAYIVESCAHPINQCLTAVAQERKSGASTTLNFYWKNDTSDAKDVFIILDRDGDPFSEQPIDYDIKIEAPKCVPGETKCGDTSAGEVEGALYTCRADATGWEEPYKCENECTTEGGGTAHCKDEPTAENCSNPKAVKFENGTYTYSIDLNDTKLGTDATPSNTSAAGCGNIRYYASKERDAVFKLDATGHDTYTIKAKPTQESSAIHPTIWIAKEDLTNSICSGGQLSGEQCINGVAAKEGQTASLTFAPEEGHYFIVVTSELDLVDDDKKAMPKKLDVTFTAETKGTPLEVKGCTSGEIIYNDIYGREQHYSCQCTDGEKECADKSGANCVSAILVNDSTHTGAGSRGTLLKQHITQSDTNELGYLRNPTEPFRVDQCMFNEDALEDAPLGSDKFYKFTLGANTTLKVDFKITDSSKAESVVAFFQEDKQCGNPLSCTGSMGGAGDQTLYYTNDSSTDKVVYLVVKYIRLAQFTSEKTPFSLDWSIDSTSTLPCSPGARTCDSNNVKECQLSSLGVASWKSYTCANGCEEGFCKLPAATAEGKSCSAPLDAGTGGVFYITPSTERGEGSDPLAGNCSTSIRGDDRNHYFLKVTAKDGQVIKLTSASPSEDNFKVILFKGCDSNRPKACLKGDYSTPAPFSKNKKVFTYIADESTDYYIDLISSDIDTVTPFYVSVDVSEPECTKSTPEECTDVNGVGYVTYCNNGQKARYSCGSACNSLGNGCATKSGKTCPEAITLHTFPQKRTLTAQSIDSNATSNTYATGLDTGISGACMYNAKKSLSSGEKYYSFKLKKKETLEVKLEDKKGGYFSDSGYYMFLLQNCSLEQCVASYKQDKQVTKQQYLTFTAPEDDTYTLVVDSSKPSTEQASFDLTYSVTKKNPCFSHCKDDSTLVTCDASGFEVETSCNCKLGYCESDIAKVNTCDTNAEPVINERTSFYRTIVPLPKLNDSEHSSIDYTTSMCPFDADKHTSRSLTGNDAFYKVEVPAGHKLTARLDGPENETTGLYLSSSCSFSDCILTGIKKATYKNDENNGFMYVNKTLYKETLYIGVDSVIGDFDDPNNAPRVLNIELSGGPSCDPSTTTPSCENNKLKFCNPSIGNFISSYPCACTNGESQCTTPTGNTCVDAIELTPNGTSLTGDLTSDKLSSKGDLTIEKHGICSIPEPKGAKSEDDKSKDSVSKGRDVIYKVEVPAGKPVKVTLSSTSTTKQNLMLYATKDCYQPASQCTTLSNNPDVQEETIELPASSSTQTYFLYVDSPELLTNNGEYTIKAETL